MISEFFDYEFYINEHDDLANMTGEQARHHFSQFGIREDRAFCELSYREHFLNYLKGFEGEILEIGPFASPNFVGERVKYFDVLDAEKLRERALKIGLNEKNIPKSIDFVSEMGDFSIVDQEFDVVFSSHSIEHQVDLIGFFQSAFRLLKKNCVIGLIVPDKRYCFDHFLPASDVVDALAAHADKSKRHTVQNLFRHRIGTTHNDPLRHWMGDHGEINLDRDAIESVMVEWKENEGTYMDVHAWQFQPSSFKKMMGQLKDAGFFNYEIMEVFPTPKGRLEFTVLIFNSF
jgi:SAM-dependent methyltransferase